MGLPQPHRPVLLFVAVFSRHPEAIAWGKTKLESTWGQIALESPVFDFRETSFYEATMGAELKKQLWAFERTIEPQTLPALKHQTNVWEEDYRQGHDHAEPRPLNLDPGYVTEAKLVLATTKDRDHRLFLADGIFGEVTLFFRQGAWQSRPWTYPDYQRAEYHQFLSQCREYLRVKLRS
jgi:hypothetical protein